MTQSADRFRWISAVPSFPVVHLGSLDEVGGAVVMLHVHRGHPLQRLSLV